MKLEVSSSPILDQQADTLILPVGKGNQLDESGRAVDAALDGQLSSGLQSVGFSGGFGSTSVLPTFGRINAERIVVMGTGNPNGINVDQVRRTWGVAGRAARDAGARAVASSPPPESMGPDGLRAAAEGAQLGLYRYLAYRSESPAWSDIESLTFVDLENGGDSAISQAEQLSAGVNLARDLVNAPGLDLFPEQLAGQAWEIAEQYGLSCTVYDREALAEMGAGAIIGVGQGSAQEPRLIHLVYTPDGTSKGTIGLVGKAITFDTGGFNLKQADGMRNMKIDMAGGAAVLGAMRAISEIQPPFTVHGVIAAAENMPSHTAIRPGDVLRTLSGRTVEITNTDAEGRLVLADALTFTARQGAESMIDLATLTGASVVALGDDGASLFGTDDQLVADILSAGGHSGERMWRMPLWGNYRADLDSDIADIKNSGNRDGGAIKAALFLREFTNGVPWAHLDIAGPAWSSKQSGYLVKGGTGFGVSTLVTLLEQRATA